MFIVVRYGQDESLLCNPSCAVINLLSSIKQRAGFGNTNLVIDLSDETGLIKELDGHKLEHATNYLASHNTYILLQKILQEDDHQSIASPQYIYKPLLERYEDLLPDFKLHVAEVVEKKKTKRLTGKSPSPAGKLPSKAKKNPGSKTPSKKK